MTATGEVKQGHMPGPWKVEGRNGKGGWNVTARGWLVARTGPYSLDAQANATLIAAAPAMLEAGQALQAAREQHRLNATRENADKVSAASDAFDAAIRLATGAG